MSFVWFSFLDSGNNNSHLTESLSLGQGEVDGAILRWRSRGPFQGGSCHQSLRETKKRAKGNDRDVVYLCTRDDSANDLHTHLDLNVVSIVRALVWRKSSFHTFIDFTVTSGKKLFSRGKLTENLFSISSHVSFVFSPSASQ